MPRGGKRIRPDLVEKVAPEDPGFGGEPEVAEGEIPPVALTIAGYEDPEPPAPELLALGLPPSDAAGIQKWNYQVLSTMAALVMRSDRVSEETRTKRFVALSLAAAKHYPEAARYDLAEQIRRDAEAAAGRKRAKAAARTEKREAGSGAKVIPLRRDA